MKKQIWYLLVATSLVFGCTSAVKSDRQVASFAFAESEVGDSYKGLLDQDPLPTSNPLIISKKGGGTYDCGKIAKVNYTFNGKTYTKLRLDDDIQLRCPNVKAYSPKMTWNVKKTTWTDQDEAGFGAFVKQLGESQCKNLDRCLSMPASNPLISEEDMLSLYYSDCADLPYFLRAYYAYKKGLPFSFVNSIQPAPFSTNQLAAQDKKRQEYIANNDQAGLEKYEHSLKDLRYSINGNIAVSSSNSPNTSGVIRDFSKIKVAINDGISTATYRMLDGDFYSPKITRDQIRPGTAIYGTGGHAAIVYDVKPNGQIKVIDAHPGNSITHNGWIKKEFHLSSPRYGGMFKNFRPIQVTNPQYDSAGNIVKGLVVKASNESIPGFSLEQYDENNFKVGNKKVDLEMWTSMRLSGGSYRVDPVAEMIEGTNQLCSSFTDRVPDVAKASGLTRSSISEYPGNIFGAHGDWETFSTPSSDLRRRSDTLSLLDLAKENIKRVNERDPMVSYSGTNLKADLVAAYTKTASACKITYKNSVGQPVTLNLLQLTQRVGRMSFDPYMCPEVRWGATGTELATCTDSAQKKEFYKLTQFLRNNNVKDPNAVHGYTLEKLRALEAGKKVNNNPNYYNYDIAAQLSAL